MNKREIIHELLFELRLYKKFLLYYKTMEEFNNKEKKKY